MGRNLSPVLRSELANLDKGPDSRKSAMKALKSYVKDLDSTAIPSFLAQVSETNEIGSLSGEYTISLYEVLAKVHGVNIVSQIDSIMDTIVKTLSSSAGSFPLQQACSKVIPTIARYGIDPTAPEEKKKHVIHSLCKPLVGSLLGNQDSLTSGAALCLKALVDCDNWRFASDEMVNKVCQNVAVALEEKATQTNAHMSLAMSLAKNNPLIVEAYARLLIRSGLRILNTGIAESNSQKRLSAIQMINFLMKSLDVRCIVSELDPVIEEMEKCQSDHMAFVSGAAYEALETAMKIMADKLSKLEKTPASMTGSNYSKKNDDNLLMTPTNPESQFLNSFPGYDSVNSPSPYINSNDCRSVTRKLWSDSNERMNLSLKDGLFSGLSSEESILDSFSDESRNHEHINNDNCSKGFSGFFSRSPSCRRFVNRTPSPKRVEHIGHIFTTPRRLFRSLQEPDVEYSDKQKTSFRSPASVKYSAHNHDNQAEYISDSNSSSNGIVDPLPDKILSCNAKTDGKNCQDSVGFKRLRKTLQILFALLVALAAFFVSVDFLVKSNDRYIVPT